MTYTRTSDRYRRGRGQTTETRRFNQVNKSVHILCVHYIHEVLLREIEKEATISMQRESVHKYGGRHLLIWRTAVISMQEGMRRHKVGFKQHGILLA